MSKKLRHYIILSVLLAVIGWFVQEWVFEKVEDFVDPILDN